MAKYLQKEQSAPLLHPCIFIIIVFSYILPCCLFQVVYYRAGEPLLLPADGSVDAQHRPVLHSQTPAAGSAFFRPRLSAPFLLCYEHPGGGSSQKLSPLII